MFWFRHLLLHLWLLGCLYLATQAWRVDMPRNIKGLLNSCLVIPCSFDYHRYPPTRADRVVWYQYVSRGYPLVYDNLHLGDVIEMYRGRTHVYTSTYKKSCTLEIKRVNWNDHRQKLYPWVDPENVGKSTYAFYDTTVTIEVIGQPQPPQIMIVGERKVGNSVTVQCSARHTCSTDPPTLSFNIAMKDNKVTHTALSDGTSKTTLTATLVLERDFQVVECTVKHPGGKTATTSETLTAQCHAQEPQMSIIDAPRVGNQSRITCKVQHTCSFAPPVLTLSGIPGTDRTVDSLLSDGIWERTIERTWNVEEDHKKLECTVRYPGGQSAKSELLLPVECPFETIKMVEPPGELTEGVAKSVICSVSYKCKTNTPTIEWNVSDMLYLPKHKKISSNTYTTESNLTFIGSLEDNGKPLTCTAHFVSGETSNSSLLQIKKYVSVEEELNEEDAFRVLAADVPVRFNALTRSCVVIPCSFQDDEDQPLTRGIWYKKTGGMVYHNARSKVLDHFKDRTKILGNLNEGDCSLEIDDIKPFDNGPFCFYGEKDQKNTANKYRFSHSCAFIVMKASPEKPVMSSVPAQVDAGSTVNVSCSVSHSCSSHPPTFSWSVPSINNEVSDTVVSRGVWKSTSTITFLVAGGDGPRNLNCTATFWGGKNQTRTFTLIVEGTIKYEMQKSVPVVIPVVILVLILFAVVLGIFFCRKRKQADDPMRPLRSVWSRFSRQSEEGQIGWQNTKRPHNSTDLRVSYLNDAEVVVCDKQVNKQRYPSPKNNQRRPAPPTPKDCKVYDNL